MGTFQHAAILTGPFRFQRTGRRADGMGGERYFEPRRHPPMTDESNTEQPKARRPKASKATIEEPIEKQLWKTADPGSSPGIRKNIDAAEYKHSVLGLVHTTARVPLRSHTRNAGSRSYFVY
ncbi:MAG: hypothetical protein IPL52_16920 [Flavobacteriales bacterium]|nr:hypothetical protein [Flavobacteriales bacterium]